MDRRPFPRGDGQRAPDTPVLTSSCASDRLRRLSVEADKGPSHVFCGAESPRLGDAFDGFAPRLDPPAGEIGAQAFHPTRPRGAGRRPESPVAPAPAPPPPAPATSHPY